MPQIETLILGVIAAAFLALGLTIFVQHRIIVSDRAHYEALLKSESALQAENASWKVLADSQNKKVGDLAKAQAAHDAALAKALNAAKKTADRYAAQAESVMNLKTPADDCVGAMAVRDGFLKITK